MGTPTANVIVHYIEQVVPLAVALRGKELEGEGGRALCQAAGGLDDSLEDLGDDFAIPLPPEYEDSLTYLGAALWTDAEGRLAYGDDWLDEVRKVERVVRPLQAPVKGLNSLPSDNAADAFAPSAAAIHLHSDHRQTMADQDVGRPPAGGHERRFVFEREETSLWHVQFGEDAAIFPEMAGIVRIHRLLARPNQAMTCRALMGPDKGGFDSSAAPDPVMDKLAEDAVERELERKQELAQEAVDREDIDRATALGREIEELEAALKAARNPATRRRKNLGTPAEEKARKAVRKSVLDVAVPVIDAKLPSLARHLREWISIGLGKCIYHQDDDHPIRWEL